MNETFWPPGFIDFYQTRYPEFARLAFLLVQDQMEAEAIAQDSMLAVADRWDDLRVPQAYCRTVVVNKSRRVLRDRGRMSPAPSRRFEDVSQRDRPDELWDMLATLSDRQKAAVVLRYYLGLPDDEIAETLGCRRSTVRSLVRRALEVMRTAMADIDYHQAER